MENNEEKKVLRERLNDLESDLERDLEEIKEIKEEVKHLEEEEHHHHNKCNFIIIVNGEEKEHKEDHISFKQVVELAFGEMVTDGTKAYTVTYKNGPAENPEGSMTESKVVKIKEKMRFVVTQTNRS